MSTNVAHEFVVSLHANGAATLSAPPRPPIVTGPPPEFGGAPETWSPEHLLLAAVSGCLSSTFRALAVRKGLAVRGLQCVTTGTVAKTPSGLAFTGIRIAAEVDVAAEDVARAVALLAEAERRCIVSNSLKVPVVLHSVANLAPARPEERETA
jgi:organic hydroperoxide reductase OsmC/OhrA